MRLVTGLLVLGLSFSIGAKAESFDAKQEAHRIVTAIDQGGIVEESNNSMASLIQSAADALRKSGHKDEAEKLAREWKVQSQEWLAGSWALGDHAPLFPFLSKTYLRLEKLLGPGLMRSLRLTDIHILNHALPVVFNPKGRDWDRAEYRKHFMPLAGVLLYWGTYAGCRYVIPWPKLARICNPAASWARWSVQGTFGEKLSDRVYVQFVPSY